MTQSAEEFVLRHALLTAQEVAHLRNKHRGVNFLAAAAQEGLLPQELAEDCQRLCDAGLFDGIEPHIKGIVLLELIGKGGSGRVYRAWQTNLRRVVAVKVLPHASLATKETLGRAVREARIAARLSHPSLVRAYDVAQTKDSLYIVLEYVEGETLADRLKQNAKLSVREALKIAYGIAEGLAFVAANRIAHRDIKPANIQLTPKGAVKILDLGLARPEGESTLTAPLVVHGTPSFVSPEQARGETNLSPAVDVYALGVIMFRALSGRHPFKVETPQDMLRAHMSGKPPALASVVRDVPPALSDLIASMLAKRPSERPDAATVAGHLRLYLERMGEMSGSTLADTGRQERTTRVNAGSAQKPIGVAVLVVALVLGGLAIWFLSGGENEQLQRERELLEREQQAREREDALDLKARQAADYARSTQMLANAAKLDATISDNAPPSIESALDEALREQDHMLKKAESSTDATPPEEKE